MDWKSIFLLCFIVVINNTPVSCGEEGQAQCPTPTSFRRFSSSKNLSKTESSTPSKNYSNRSLTKTDPANVAAESSTPSSAQKNYSSRSLTKTHSANEANVLKAVDNYDKRTSQKQTGHNCQIVFDQIDITQIMGSVQLGITHVMKNLTLKSERNLLMTDFVAVQAIGFPSQGSEGVESTPKHEFPAFTFKWYAPVIFHYFRELYEIYPDGYQNSFCSKPLKQIGNSGASASLFFKTNDDKYIMKSLQKTEGKFLQKLLPGYHLNFNQNPSTLLPKFFGFYRYQCNAIHVSTNCSCSKIRNIRLVAMNNLIPTDVEIHEKYDLKGSTHKRKASDEEMKKKKPTLKDLDFIEKHPSGIFLELSVYEQLVATIKRDCRVLQSFKIMDYSLLMGVHYVRPEEKTKKGTTVERLYSSVGKEKKDFISRGVIPAKTKNNEDVILYIGIIDILQSYRWQKQLEHAAKAQVHDSKTISVHRPSFYATRFLNFMKDSVFRVITRKSHKVQFGRIVYDENLNKKKEDGDDETEEILSEKESEELLKKKTGFRSLRALSDGAILLSYKNIKSKYLMRSFQLGIKQIVAGLGINPKLDLLISDFQTNEQVEFLRQGSVLTNPKHIPEFTFKTYAPIIFHYFKALYEVDLNDYQNSICSEPLREVSNSGASGSLFYFTSDDKYIMKTVQQKESKFLLKLLSGYYLNVKQNPNTLLPKFFGHYRYKCVSMKHSINALSPKKMKTIRLIVMNNLIPSNIKIHQKYDLKGSTHKRKASDKERGKKTPTLKDLDFVKDHPNGLYLESKDYNILMNSLKSDVSVLETHKIMDYSLLMAVQKLDGTEEEGKSYTEKQTGDAKEKDTSTIRGFPAKNSNGERLMLYIGIIDILQKYSSSKRFEHMYKSMLHEANTTSVQRPKVYAQRFLEFMTTSVFKSGSTTLGLIFDKVTS